MTHFATRLAEAVRRCRTPVMVGLDPRVAQLPEELQPRDSADPEQVARAFSTFCREVIDTVAPLVAVVKPQSAFFEALGPPGGLALAETIAHARQRGLLVLLDAKRGDIGTTAEAYAQAYLGPGSGWQADALTVNPYLGDDSLTPFVRVAREQGAGLFVLVKTSNPGGGLFQDLRAGDRPLYRHVAALVEQLAGETADETGYGIVGAVCGATYPAQLAELREALPHAWLLVPGYGAQGGGAADVAGAFDPSGLGALVNNSRGIIFAHRQQQHAELAAREGWQAAVLAATREMIDELRRHTAAGNL